MIEVHSARIDYEEHRVGPDYRARARIVQHSAAWRP